MKKITALAAALLLTAAIPAFLGAQDIDPLVKAYQREFIYLDNEIRLLQQRITEVEKDGGERVERARDNLNSLENRLLSLQDRVEREIQTITFLEDEENSSYNAYDTVMTVINQAGSRLEKYSIPGFKESVGSSYSDIPESEIAGRELDYVFTESIAILDDSNGIKTEDGAFFLPDGKLVEGSLVRIGQIAAFGTSKEYAGTLSPVGAGQFRLFDAENAGAARKLASGEQPRTLPLFIYESTDKMIETAAAKTIADTIEGGGVIGLVIIALGGIALILVVLRAFGLFRISSGASDSDIDSIVEEIEQGKLEPALAACRKLGGAARRVLENTVNGLITAPKQVEDSIAESVLNEQPALNRFRSAISVFAAVAPLLGLLGTVTGMISTFEIITVYGTGDPKLLSGGISEALVTTELGLVVAIPTLLLGNLLSTWSDRINSNLEVSALRMVNAATGFKRERKARKAGKKA